MIWIVLGGINAEPLSNFEIRVGVSQEIKRNPMCGAPVAVTLYGEIWTSECIPALPGQFVSLHKIGNVHLTVCEVAVYARQGNVVHAWNTIFSACVAKTSFRLGSPFSVVWDLKWLTRGRPFDVQGGGGGVELLDESVTSEMKISFSYTYYSFFYLRRK